MFGINIKTATKALESAKFEFDSNQTAAFLLQHDASLLHEAPQPAGAVEPLLVLSSNSMLSVSAATGFDVKVVEISNKLKSDWEPLEFLPRF